MRKEESRRRRLDGCEDSDARFLRERRHPQYWGASPGSQVGRRWGQLLRKPGEMRVGRGGLNGSFGVGGLRRAGGERQRTLGRDTTRPVGRVRA